MYLHSSEEPSVDDLIRIEKSESYFHKKELLDAVPENITELKVPFTPNIAVDTRDTVEGEEVVSDYFKIDIRNKPNAYLINTQTFYKLQRAIKRRYNMMPLHGSIVCTSIVIVPCPGETCSLYFNPGLSSSQQPDDMFLIGSFVAGENMVKLPVQCPYTDSFFGNVNIHFNWYVNEIENGVIVPNDIDSGLVYGVKNTNFPFVSRNPIGSFYIDGICDAIGFNVSFMIDIAHGGSLPRRSGSYKRSGMVRKLREARNQSNVSEAV